MALASRQHALETRALAAPCRRPHALCSSLIVIAGGSARYSLRGLQPSRSAQSDRRFEQFRRATIDNRGRIGRRWAFNAFVTRWLARSIADDEAVERWVHGIKMRAAGFIPSETATIRTGKRRGQGSGIIVKRWIKREAA